MRLKPTYKFLGSGGPFCYRGIFSGLSNETVGAALYLCISLTSGNAEVQGIDIPGSFQHIPSSKHPDAIAYTGGSLNIMIACLSNYLTCIPKKYSGGVLHSMDSKNIQQ
ncbi:hypothetical protein QWZ08_00375 [Ferruginibacter paludis]|uniref:hypothetical protein n=1 Tax=Ferruginibacter paludis TaxID=1310417 RepID=UPI0025B5F085|nr:hypothetical protein [Ferruginibacter paludis]MDN3654056.1 hypothetical protein [Ferruginibacter paludis]